MQCNWTRTVWSASQGSGSSPTSQDMKARHDTSNCEPRWQLDNGRPSSSTISKSPVSARGGPHISIHAVWWQETINKQKQTAKDKSLYCNILPRHCFGVLYPKQETNQLRLIFAIWRGPTHSNSLLLHICQYSFYMLLHKYNQVYLCSYSDHFVPAYVHKYCIVKQLQGAGAVLAQTADLMPRSTCP